MRADPDFVPFAASPPASGEVLDLAVPNPRYAAELTAYRDVLARNPFAPNMLVETLAPTFSTRADELIGASALCVRSPQLTLVVGYPFNGQYAVTVTATSPDGFTRAELFGHLVHVYTAMYDGATLSPGPRKLQTRVDSPRFGTAWHRLDDLAVERVLIETRDGRTLAWITIGS